jgi:integrase
VPVKLALAEHLRRYPPITVTLPWEVAGGPPQGHRLVVSAVRGGVVDAKDFNKDRWKPALRAVRVPCGSYENGMHELRHFFASVLLDQGESIKAVAEWLGHSDPSFTLKTYTHLMPSSDERDQGRDQLPVQPAGRRPRLGRPTQGPGRSDDLEPTVQGTNAGRSTRCFGAPW